MLRTEWHLIALYIPETNIPLLVHPSGYFTNGSKLLLFPQALQNAFEYSEDTCVVFAHELAIFSKGYSLVGERFISRQTHTGCKRSYDEKVLHHQFGTSSCGAK